MCVFRVDSEKTQRRKRTSSSPPFFATAGDRGRVTHCKGFSLVSLQQGPRDPEQGYRRGMQGATGRKHQEGQSSWL